MTHTLHREGTREDLQHDFVALTMPSTATGVNVEGSGEKLKQWYDIAMKFNPVNIGTPKVGNMYSLGDPKICRDKTIDAGMMHAVFTNEKDLIGFLTALKEADLGLSTVVSGLSDRVDECCQKAGLHRHTVNFSLGVHGRTDKLPDEPHREITTMCGHGMVTADMVTNMVQKIKAGRITPEEAGKELAKPCVCGVFNPVRAAEHLARMAGLEVATAK